MNTLATAALTGILATLAMDVWAAIAKHVLHLPTAHWNLVGRWFGHMAEGVFVHRPIADATPVRNELLLGWTAHYLIGIVYGIAWLAIVQGLLGQAPTPPTGVAFGLVTVIAPWCVMQPAMGAGFFARNTPEPGVVRLVNLSMHGMFGLALYPAWWLASGAMA